MVGHPRIAHGPQKHRVEGVKLFGAVVGHHAARCGIGFAAPGEFLPVERDAVTGAGDLEHADGLGHDFLADTVAGDERNSMRGHDRNLVLPCRAI